MKKTERTGTRLFVAIAAALSLLLSMNSAALAQDNYTSQPTANLSPAPSAGGTVTVSGTGPLGATVVASLDGVALGSTVIAVAGASLNFSSKQVADGVYSFSVTIPSDLAPGNHVFTVTIDGVTVSSTSFAVGAAAQEPAEEAAQLPNTGSDTLPLTQLALVLIGAGSLLLVMRRRHIATAE